MEEQLNLSSFQYFEGDSEYSLSTFEYSNSTYQGGNVVNTDLFQTEFAQVSDGYKDSRVMNQTKPIHNDQKDYQIDDKHFHLSITYPGKEIDIGSFTDKDVNEILEMQSKSYEVSDQVMLVPLKNAFYPIEAKHSISNEVSDQNNARIFNDNQEVPKVAFGSSRCKVTDSVYKSKRESNTQHVWKNRKIDANAEKCHCICGGEYLGQNGLKRHQAKNPYCRLKFFGLKVELNQNTKPKTKKIPVVCEVCGIAFSSIKSHKTKSPKCRTNHSKEESLYKH